MQLKFAMDGEGGRELIPLTVDDAWIKTHGMGDREATVAIAMHHAERGARAYRATIGNHSRSKIVSMRLAAEVPEGSLPLVNPEVLQPQGLSCYICLCDDASPPNCVCTPC